MRTLHVVLYGEHVADLVQTRGGAHQLRYLTDAPPAPISLSMPATGRTYGTRRVDPYLKGLLPDAADVREELGRRYGVSGENPFALLEHLGADCAGAVQFLPPEQLDDVLAGHGELVPTDEQQIGARLSRLRRDTTASWIASQENWSLAGAQSKFAVRVEDGRHFSPEGAEPTTHIIKPGIAEFRDQALNEHLCMSALRRAGVSAAETAIRDFDGQTALVVQRFDRTRQPDGTLIRIHQEDMCQASGVDPRKKYEAAGGPRAVDIVNLLRRWSGTDAETNLDRFIDGLISNQLLGAPDAHAKNYGVMLVGPEVHMSPLYDVASSLPYDAEADSDLQKTAMKIGRENRFGHIEPRHWRRFAQESGLDPRPICDRVLELAERIPASLEAAAEETLRQHSSQGQELAERLVERVHRLGAITRSQYASERQDG